MSDSLSLQLLREIQQNIVDTSNRNETIGEIEVNYEIVPGKRGGSHLVWAFEDEFLFYKNSLSKKSGNEACKCIEKGCNARMYICEDGSAFKHSVTNHNHGSMYSSHFKYTYCFDKMKQKAKRSAASTSSYEIYSAVVLE